MLLNTPDNHIHLQRDFFVVALRPLWYTSWPCNDCGSVGFTVANLGEGGRGAQPPPPYFKTKLSPEGQKTFFWILGPPSLI